MAPRVTPNITTQHIGIGTRHWAAQSCPVVPRGPGDHSFREETKEINVIADFHVRNKAERDEKLEAAVTAARSHALAEGAHGLLVTRHEFGRFSVALSADVPFGLIREHDLAGRN